MLDNTPREISATEATAPDVTAFDWLSANRVRIAAVLLVCAQVWWMAAFLSKSFFRSDDFYFLERGLSNGLTWKYLMWSNYGHVTPVGFAISWVLVRISPMDWTLTSAVTLVMVAAAGLALLRLLRTLFGDHPAILLLMLVYLVSPLGFPGLSWWSVTLELLPLEIAMFSALTSHVKYVRTGHFRHAWATALWLLIGMLSSVKGVGVPLLLLAITSGWLIQGRWSAALGRTLRQHWRAWLIYAIVLGGYVVTYAAQVRASGEGPTRPGGFSGVFGYIGEIITNTFVPGVLGGPWNWVATTNWSGNPAYPGEYGVASAPADLVRAACVVAVAIIVVSVWQQPRAWRAWTILFGWLVVVDTIPALGRLSYLPASLLGHETRYVMEAVGVLVVCAGLAFLPQAGQQITRWHRIAGGRPTTAVVVGLTTALVIGSLVSYHNYLGDTSNVLPRSYFATAQAALAQAPAGTEIVNATVPAYVTDTFPNALGSEVRLLGPLRTTAGTPKFVSTRVSGTIDQLRIFNGWGQLVLAGILGAGATAPECFPVSKDGTITVRLGPFPAREVADELRLGYVSGSNGDVVVTYDGQSQTIHVLKGLHSGFLPIHGQSRIVAFNGLSRGFCVGDVEAGQLWPRSTNASPVPAQLVSG